MKKTNSPLVFGAFVVACLAAVRCGGSDSPATTNNNTAGTPSNAGANNGGANNGGSIGAGGANNGGANNGGANNGGANNGGANNGGSVTPTDGGGGSANPGDGSAGTAVGAGGTQVGGDAGMCPAAAPMNNSMCTGNVDCDYVMGNMLRSCSCLGTGPRGDGGVRAREWNCQTTIIPTPRDAGGGADAGARCPNGTNDGDRCTMPGQLCRTSGFGNGSCVCVMVGANAEWFCN